jgi:hypothetical protein
MQWVFDNIQIIIIVAAVIASWLNGMRKTPSGGPAPGRPFDEDGEPAAPPADADDLTRRIQEEIRRKIAERRGETAPDAPPPFQPEPTPPLHTEPSATEPPPIPVAPTAPVRTGESEWDIRQRQLREELRRQAAERAAMTAPPALPAEMELTVDEEDALARQRELAERLAALEQARQRAAANAAALTGTSPATRGVRNLRGDLRDPAALRRAIVLNELLGPPAALR